MFKYLTYVFLLTLLASPVLCGAANSKEVHELPVSNFIRNSGEIGSDIQYYSRQMDHAILFRDSSFDVVFVNPTKVPSNSSGSPRGITPPRSFSIAGRLKFQLLGYSRNLEISGENMIAPPVHYILRKKDQSKLFTSQTFEKVQYKNIYDGVDLVFYRNNSSPEYDFIVSPREDPAKIRYSISGARSWNRNEEGDLEIHLGNVDVTQKAPIAFQQIDGKRRNVACNVEILMDKGRSNDLVIGYSFGKFDSRYPLVIDPALVFSTHFGGTGYEYIAGVAVNNAGESFVTGVTYSPDILTADALDSTCGTDGNCNNSLPDIFISKISADQTTVLFSTYVGGSRGDSGAAIALDSNSNVYVTGVTNSSDFPVTAGAFDLSCGLDATCNDGTQPDCFVLKLTPNGSALLYSTYLGGSRSDQAQSVVVDSDGAAYIVGLTDSRDFPTSIGTFDPTCGTDGQCDQIFFDAFLTKLSPNGSSLMYSTYYGGEFTEWPFDVAVNGNHEAYMVGYTTSKKLPVTKKAFDATCGTDGNCNPIPPFPTPEDAFVAKFKNDGSGLLFSTYLGGSGSDIALSVLTNDADAPVVVGSTTSADFPTKNAFQNAIGGGRDAFVVRFTSNGELLNASYYGGSGDDIGTACSFTSDGSVLIAGTTSSADLPVLNPIQFFHGGNDSFVAKIGPSGCSGTYSTYLGGSGYDVASSIRAKNDTGYVVGQTYSADFPDVNPIETYSGNSDGFLSMIVDSSSPQPLLLDEFSDGIVDWQISDGQWSESNGLLHGVSSGSATILAPNVWQPSDLSSCTLMSVDSLVRTNGGSGSSVSLIGWYQDSSNFVEVVMNQSGGKWILQQRVKGDIINKAFANATIFPGTFYDVKVRYDGANFQLYIDGSALLSMPSRGIPFGNVGFKLKSTTADFDRIIVE